MTNTKDPISLFRLTEVLETLLEPMVSMVHEIGELEGDVL